MKILHFINTLSAGGAELHLLTLSQHLKRAGLEVVVAYLKDSKGIRHLRADFEDEGIQVMPLEGKRPWDARYLMRAARLVQSEQPDVIHTHLPRADAVGFFIHLLIPSVPWICSVHDIYSKSWRAKNLLPVFRLIWRRTNRIIAISEAVKSWLVQDLRIPANKVQVIYYGIEPARFIRPSQDLRSAWGLCGRPVIGSIGRLEPRKGHDLLIQAMPFVLRRVPSAILLIAGPDPWGYGRTLEELVKQLKLSAQIRLIGFQSDICSFLQAIDVFAFGSRSEGFGQVVIEAMAAGKPVVVQRIAPLTEIVINEETGFCVEPESPEALADAIVWLLQHPEEAKRMGQKGIERVYNAFSGERMAQETLSLYRHLLSKDTRS
ncbi:MAG: glycosyltransferase family 4 protein [Thermoproteota archaeon]